MKALSGHIRPVDQFLFTYFMCYLKRMATIYRNSPTSMNITKENKSWSSGCNAPIYVILDFVHWEESAEVRVHTDTGSAGCTNMLKSELNVLTLSRVTDRKKVFLI